MTAFLNTVCDTLFARSKWQRFTFFSVFSNSSFFCPTLSCTCAFVMAHFKIVYFSALTVFQCCLIYQTKNIRNFLGRENKRNFINIKVLFSFLKEIIMIGDTGFKVFKIFSLRIMVSCLSRPYHFIFFKS